MANRKMDVPSYKYVTAQSLQEGYAFALNPEPKVEAETMKYLAQIDTF